MVWVFFKTWFGLTLVMVGSGFCPGLVQLQKWFVLSLVLVWSKFRFGPYLSEFKFGPG